MPNYNPTATEKLGIELVPTGASDVSVASSGVGAGMRVTSLAAENIGIVQLWVDQVLTPGYYILDIYEFDDALYTGSTAVSVYNPNEDVTLVNITGSPTNTAGNRYQNVDEGTNPWSTTDYLRCTTTLQPTSYSCRFGSGGFSGRPLSLKVNTVWSTTGDEAESYIQQQDIVLVIGGTEYKARTTADSYSLSSISYSPGGKLQWAVWNKNPATGAPWTAAEIQSFDSTNSVKFTWSPRPWDDEHLNAMDMQVTYAPETRVAFSSPTLFSLADQGWEAFAVTNPSGGTWAKGNAIDYLYVLRRQGTVGSAIWGGYAVQADHAIPNFDGYNVTIVDGMVTALAQVDRMSGIIIRTTAPADSADSQVYVDVTSHEVDNTHTHTTEFSNAAAKQYGLFAVIVNGESDPPNQDLLVKIKRRSDNVQMGGTATIDKDDLDQYIDLGNGWRLVTGTLASIATLAAATQYYVEYSSTATTGNWYVRGLTSGPPAGTGSGAALTFGGTTDRATNSDGSGSESDFQDILFNLATVPTAPTNFAGSVNSVALVNDGSEGTVASIERCTLTWTATALGGTFSYYELQRSEDAGVTWYTVGIISPEATATFHDYEATRGLQSRYRLRVLRSDGAFSDWTATVSLTPAALKADVWSFVSNEDPTLNCAFYKQQGVEYLFPDADEVEMHPVSGDDYFVALQPTEDRGVRVESLPLVISSLSSYNRGSNALGWAAYNRIRAMAKAENLQYTCIHDPYGNRILGKLIVPLGSYTAPTVWWVAVVQIYQITSEFSTPGS